MRDKQMMEMHFQVTKEFLNKSRIIFGRNNSEPLRFEKRYLYCMSGENGLGKTTLLNICSMLTGFSGGYSRDTDGLFVINGHDNAEDKDIFRKKEFSYIFQDPHILNTFTIEENIKLVNPAMQVESDFQHIIDNVTLADEAKETYLKKKLRYLKERLDSSPFFLSGGEKQLLSFIRAMVKPSRILFADEPWANMDQELKDFVEEQLFLYLTNDDMFAQFRTQNTDEANTVIIITHAFHHKDNQQIGKDDAWEYVLPVEMHRYENNLYQLEKANDIRFYRYSR